MNGSAIDIGTQTILSHPASVSIGYHEILRSSVHLRKWQSEFFIPEWIRSTSSSGPLYCTSKLNLYIGEHLLHVRVKVHKYKS